VNELVPLRGVLYDPARAGPIERLLAPPYDVISPADREALAALDEHNIVRVIVPQGDYAGAARLLSGWIAQGVLRRDDEPALYRYQQTFDSDGRTWTRSGFIGGLRLRRFDERWILPHERTLAAPKLDRLNLWRACRSVQSQIFGLYSDPAGETEKPFAALDRRPPELEGRTPDGIVHRLWRLTDAAAQRRVAEALAPRRVYIADGHHRYETLLALRDELGVQSGSFFLCRMEDPGLRVLATHRVVFGLASFSPAALLQSAAAFFTVERFTGSDVRGELAARGARAPTIGVASGGEIHFLSLKEDADLSRIPGPPVLRRLDVTLLHSLLLEGILGIDRAAQEKQTHLRYVKDLDQAVADRGAQAAFLLNPTPLDDLRAAADAGEVLPQKSTYFFPKLASGLVVVPFEGA
jgi:uncharacterized protein (DUF1015 family)